MHRQVHQHKGRAVGQGTKHVEAKFDLRVFVDVER
jgi:hypothetical protein